MNLKNCLPVIFFAALFFFFHLTSTDEPVKKEAPVPDLAENALPLDVANLLEEEPKIEANPKMTVLVILEPYHRVEIYPEITEEIEQIPFKLGESFKKGDLLLKMKNQLYISQLAKALKGVEYAKEDLRIKESLYKSTLISTLELFQSQYNVTTAEAVAAEAERNFQMSFVLAPFDGKVGAVHIREFERPIRQKSMLEIFNDRIMIAKFIIPSNLLHHFSIGQMIPVFVKDINKTIPAKLIRIGAEINPVSWTVTLEAEIYNFDGMLMPGMASFFEISPAQLQHSKLVKKEPELKIAPSRSNLVPSVINIFSKKKMVKERNCLIKF